jgi:hypothetical protein
MRTRGARRAPWTPPARQNNGKGPCCKGLRARRTLLAADTAPGGHRLTGHIAAARTPLPPNMLGAPHCAAQSNASPRAPPRRPTARIPDMRGAPRGARTAVGSWGSTRRAGLPPERAGIVPPSPWSVSIVRSASARRRSRWWSCGRNIRRSRLRSKGARPAGEVGDAQLRGVSGHG